MKKFTSKQLREMWLNFFEEKGHKNIGSASLIPENDPSVLFTTAGMHPLVPYLLGETHPAGKRLCDVQKCIRTGDIDAVGDGYHHTFFEMLGYWSLNDYFKENTIKWSYEFLTSPNYVGIDKNHFAVTVFGGNEFAPKDSVAIEAWKSLGLKDEQIFEYGMDENWWQIGRGPCGPCSEMFIDTGKPKCCEECGPSCSCGKYIEVGNNVFMEYNRVEDDKYLPLGRHNVDVGLGMERALSALNNTTDNYCTEFFEAAIKKIEELSSKKYVSSGDEYTKAFRVVADHVRTAMAVLGDKHAIVPSNTDAGYILRRIIRKAIRYCKILDIEAGNLGEIAKVYIDQFKDVYPEFKENEQRIIDELNKEEEKFAKTIVAGTKEFDKMISGLERKNEFMQKQNASYVPEKEISGKSAFRLYETYGFPIELTIEMASEKGYNVDEKGYDAAFNEHQELARTASAGHFKGGLADDGVETTKLHTACHLLQAGLRKVLGQHVFQKGSNITSERLRFDFSHDKPMTADEIKEVEDFVNEAINAKVPVICTELSVDKAKEAGALGVFDSKYGDIVKTFKIGDYSHEICGGPHAKNTGELGHFKIEKEQSSSAGVRRIKATLS